MPSGKGDANVRQHGSRGRAAGLFGEHDLQVRHDWSPRAWLGPPTPQNELGFKVRWDVHAYLIANRPERAKAL